MSKFTTTAGQLQTGDRIGRAVVRYSILSDSGAAYLVFIEGFTVPRRYGRHEPITVERP